MPQNLFEFTYDAPMEATFRLGDLVLKGLTRQIRVDFADDIIIAEFQFQIQSNGYDAYVVSKTPDPGGDISKVTLVVFWVPGAVKLLTDDNVVVTVLTSVKKP
jgi:hypothetical protein